MAPSPARTPSTLEALLVRIGRLWLAYIKGQALEALSIGALTWVVNSAIGLSWALLLGLLAGLMETVPGVGPLVALVPAAAVALWRGSTVIPVPNWAFALIVVGTYLAIQQIGSLIIQPRLLGKRLDLPPLVVLAAVIIGAALAGIVGAYLAVPAIVTVREVYRFFRDKGTTPHAEG